MHARSFWLRGVEGLLLVSLVCSALSLSIATAASPDGEKVTAEGLVQEALHRDLYGLHADRRKLLEDAARMEPNYGPAQWHRGRLREGRGWADVETLIRERQPTPLEKEYMVQRAAMRDTVEGHLALANWTRDRDLPVQERAHLSRILQTDPDHLVARTRLGFTLVDGVWRSAAEIESARRWVEQVRAAEERWRPVLLDVRRGLLSGTPPQRQSARERLASVRDPAAIPIMEAILSTVSEEAALAVVDALQAMPEQEAVDGLVRHAVYSQWPLVRDGAAERLRDRPRESYVPNMLGQMFTSTSSLFQVAILPDGRLGYRHMLHREGWEDQQLLILDTAYVRNARPGGDGRETLARAFLDSVVGVTRREAAIAQRNLLQLTLNERLSEALNLATRSQFPPDPQRWFQWWDAENDVVHVGGKQLRQRQAFQSISVRDRSPRTVQQFSTDLGSNQFAASGAQPGGRCECFAAGTLVLTRHGSVPIEQVQVGDLVLAQQIESGELAFQPVLGTTIRPPEPLMKLHVGDEVLETSRGHLFWVAGTGWRQAQELEAGSPLHGLHGSLTVSHTEEGAAAPTYNLIVADFHTYFVGQGRVLAHDVTQRRPTAAILPGLVTRR